MGLFQSPTRQALKPHVHAAEEQCPWCEQPISHAKFEDIRRRMTAEQNDRLAALTQQFERDKAGAEAKAKAALEQARAEAAAAAEQRVQAARSEAAKAAETAMLARLAETQGKLAQAEQAKAAALAQTAAVKAEQDAAVAQRVAQMQETLQKERDATVLAEKAKVLKLQSELADMQRKLEGKSAHELGEGSEVDLFEQLRTAFEGDRIQRVPKGVNGADVIHEVIHNNKVCGKIIYDAKNRDAWQNGFATKLRSDKLAQGADHAILSSNKFPKDKSQIHCQDGVIVANPARVLAIVEILRGPAGTYARAAHQQRGTGSQDGRALRLHHLRALQAARRAGRSASGQDAGPRHQGAGGTPAPLGSAQEADQLGAEGARRPHLRDRPHHRHGRGIERPGSVGRRAAGLQRNSTSTSGGATRQTP